MGILIIIFYTSVMTGDCVYTLYAHETGTYTL